MSLTSNYLVATSRLEEFFDALRSAQAPDKFTLSFLRDLGFTSSNERLFIGMLKALGFLDDAGVPQQRYFDFLDDSRWQIVLAEGIREAYDDLFRLNTKANELDRAEVTGKLRSLTRGQYSDSVVQNMARTFEALCSLANFSQVSAPRHEEESDREEGEGEEENKTVAKTEEQAEQKPRSDSRDSDKDALPPRGRQIDSLTYRIELVLPPVRDKAVYDALFKSLREHLL